MSIPISEWKWFGSPAHFICAAWCRFHLCTQIGNYLISTVGEYVHPPRHGMGSELKESEWLEGNWPGEDIGAGRKYETMVFKAGEPCKRLDCNCGLPKITSDELDFLGYNQAGEATKGHYQLCLKYAEK